jgi:hypothetical protein
VSSGAPRRSITDGLEKEDISEIVDAAGDLLNHNAQLRLLSLISNKPQIGRTFLDLVRIDRNAIQMCCVHLASTPPPR